MARLAYQVFEYEQQPVQVSTYDKGHIEINGADSNGEISLTADEAVKLGRYLIQQSQMYTTEYWVGDPSMG